jgi:peptide/nickel transport system ATP-binding protein
MNVCTQQHPVQREMPNGTRAQCWAADLAHGYADDLTPEQKAPLVREEFSVADEA